MLDRKKILTFTKSFEKQGKWVVLPFALLSQVKQEGHLKVSDILSTAASARESGKIFPRPMDYCLNTCHLAAANISPSASPPLLPTHCQCERRKKGECSLSDKRRKQRNQSHCTETPGLIISWIWEQVLPLPSNTKIREIIRATFWESWHNYTNFKKLLFVQRHSTTKTST